MNVTLANMEGGRDVSTPTGTDSQEELAQSFDVFISYATEDVGIARQIASALGGEFRCFVADDHLNAEMRSEHYAATIERILGSTQVLIVVVTPRALASKWVTFEWRSMHDDVLSSRRMARIVPVLLEGVEIAKLPRGLAFWKGVDAVATGGIEGSIRMILELTNGFFAVSDPAGSSRERQAQTTVSAARRSDASTRNAEDWLKTIAAIQPLLNIAMICVSVSLVVWKGLEMLPATILSMAALLSVRAAAASGSASASASTITFKIGVGSLASYSGWIGLAIVASVGAHGLKQRHDAIVAFASENTAPSPIGPFEEIDIKLLPTDAPFAIPQPSSSVTQPAGAPSSTTVPPTPDPSSAVRALIGRCRKQFQDDRCSGEVVYTPHSTSPFEVKIWQDGCARSIHGCIDTALRKPGLSDEFPSAFSVPIAIR